MKTRKSLFLLLISFIVLAGCEKIMNPGGEDPSPVTEGVSIDGKEFLLDGEPFYPRGYVFASFLYKRKDLIKCAKDPEYEEWCTRKLEAQDFYFGRGQYNDNSGLVLARDWGANTIRLNLSQGALDPQNDYYSEDYVQMVRGAVKAAKNQDFVVILTIFDESRNSNVPPPLQGNNPKTPLNNHVSHGALVKLAELFGDDPYVMLETLNEPWSPTKTDIGWQIYRDGGTPAGGGYPGVEFVGVNTIIEDMREKGAKNLIIVQGLLLTFKGFPGGFEDPLNKIVYSVHPFFGDGSDPDWIDWDGNFGNMANQHPFLITAWQAKVNKGWCEAYGINTPIEFLDYIESKNIGMMAYALDIRFSTVRDFTADPIKPTILGSQCREWAGRGTGEITRDYFLSY